MKKKKLASIALAGALAIVTFGFSIPAEAADNSTDYVLTIPAKVTVTQPGWNATDGITAKVKVGDTFDSSKKLSVTATSENDWNLKSGNNTVAYKMVETTEQSKAYSEAAATTALDISATQLDSGYTMPFGIIVEDYSSKPVGNYNDIVTFTAKVVDDYVAVSSVSISNAPSSELTVGDTGTLTASVLPDNATDKTVTWSSSNTDVLTINATTGAYEAVGVGSSTVSVQSGDKSATCTVTVKAATIPVSNVSITNAPTEDLFVNSTGTLTATVLPSNATDKTVVWSSSDSDYVSINAETGEYEVKGTKGYGSATITATATNGTEDTSDDVTATCTITGKVTYTSLSVGTVLHVGDTFYTGGTVAFNTSPLMSFNASNGVITVVEATSGSSKCYKFQRGRNGTMPNVTNYKVKDNTDGVYITGGSGTSQDKFTLAVHTTN